MANQMSEFKDFFEQLNVADPNATVTTTYDKAISECASELRAKQAALAAVQKQNQALQTEYVLRWT